MSARCPYCNGEVPDADHPLVPVEQTPAGLDPPRSGAMADGGAFVETRYRCLAGNEKLAASRRP